MFLARHCLSHYFNYNKNIQLSICLLDKKVVALKKAGCLHRWRSSLSTLSTDTAGQLDVLGHDGDPLGMDGT